MGRAAVRREIAYETARETIGALVSASPCRFFGTFLDGTRKVLLLRYPKFVVRFAHQILTAATPYCSLHPPPAALANVPPRSGANRSFVRIFDTLAKILRSQAPSSITNTGAPLFFHPSSLRFILSDKSKFGKYFLRQLCCQCRKLSQAVIDRRLAQGRLMELSQLRQGFFGIFPTQNCRLPQFFRQALQLPRCL